jgi:signal transduction histidine kinase
MTKAGEFFDVFNIKKQCAQYRVGIWECPHFLFVIMGSVIIVTILAVYFIAQRYVIEPHLVAILVIAITMVLFVLSYIILRSFERAALATKEKSEFISLMSHELRNPLSSIKWQLDLMLQKGVTALTPEEQRKALESIFEQNEFMISMVSELLEMTRLETGDIVLVPSEFPMGKLIHEIMSRFATRASFLNVNLSFPSPEEDINVRADRKKIYQIVEYLIDNGIHYSRRGGTVSISLERIDEHVKCSVSDEGVGISESEGKKIFSKYFRGESSRRSKVEGLGVALFMSKAIIEKSGGNMDFTSIEGRGSTFWFTLPVAK